MPIAFLDLPPEIRNQIYEQALVSPDPIDLWPESKPDVVDVDLQLGHGDVNRGALVRSLSKFRPAIAIHLLRACRQINREAIPFLFGCNDFRFTNEKGWIMLYVFLTHIGLSNMKHITRLHVFIPVPDECHASLVPHEITPSGEVALTGMNSPIDLADKSLEEDVRICCDNLRAAGPLTHVYFTVPTGMFITEVTTSIFQVALDLIAAMSLDVTLVDAFDVAIPVEELVAIKIAFDWEMISKPSVYNPDGRWNAPAASTGGKKQKKKWSKGKVKDKANHAVVLEKATADKLMKDVQSYRLVTVAVLVDRLKINGSLARKALKDLEEKGLIKKVVGHSKLGIYTRAVTAAE
ncbi:MAG: hypothetical protein M1817_001132 [Caeruleum heppii]|nr:MAG: hypothetical protein M1817_001132 [Caeruleum heppii]